MPFLQSWFQASPSSFAVVSGVLPASISGLFTFFLPIIMRWLTKVNLTFTSFDCVADYILSLWEL